MSSALVGGFAGNWRCCRFVSCATFMLLKLRLLLQASRQCGVDLGCNFGSWNV